MVPLCVQMVEQRQAKRRSLARPRLGQPNEVTASLKQKWDGLGLDVGGRLEAHLGDGFQQGGRKPEGVKGFQKQGDSRRKGRPFLSDGSAFRQRPSQRPSKCSSKRASLRSSHWWMNASSAARSKAASQVRFSSSTASWLQEPSRALGHHAFQGVRGAGAKPEDCPSDPGDENGIGRRWSR